VKLGSNVKGQVDKVAQRRFWFL